MTLSLRTKRVFALLVLALGGCATTSQTSSTPAVPLEQQVEQQVAVQAPGAARVGQMFAGNGPKMDFTVQLERGNCYWFSGVTDDAGEKLSLYLWGPPYEQRLTDARSPTPSATMGHCPLVSGMYRFQAKTRREGTFVVGVYAKPAPAGSLPPMEAAYGAPGYGAAVYVAPGYAQPVYAQPVYVAPGYAQPVYSGGAYGGGAVVVGPPAYGVGVVSTQPTECRMGSDGQNACGYNCKLGSNGHFYCSSVPGGRCALNSDGTWSCP